MFKKFYSKFDKPSAPLSTQRLIYYTPHWLEHINVTICS